MTATTLRNTQIVRNVMNKYPQTGIYTNKLANGQRTVKCYGANATMRDEISQVLTAAGIEFEIQDGDFTASLQLGRKATIVEVPCNW